MKTLVIYAHPNTTGHNHFILAEVEKKLRNKRVPYEVLDLYKMKYDPVMHEKEHYTAGGKTISAVNKKIQKKIAWADLLIFIYPVWWYSMPAMLKGFLDKVLTPRFAFIYESAIPKGLLKGKQAMVLYTTGGPTIFYKALFNAPKKNIKMTLDFCGIKSRIYPIGSCNKLDTKKKNRIKKTITKAFSKLDI